MIVVGLPLTFYGKIKFASSDICMGKMLKTSFSQYALKNYGWNLQCMIEEIKLSRYRQNFLGYLSLTPGSV